jgi:hypothetical protein
MEELENRRAVEMVKKLHGVVGVVACSTGELFVVFYPKGEPARLSGFTKKDLEGAIELKLLVKTNEIVKINGTECPVYMKTVNVANED